ncbi:MAG: zinc ABC transporter substrate-binding protein [Ideonella sp.]
MPRLLTMLRIAAVLLLTLRLGAACAADTPVLRVVASFSILADLASEVGGSHVEVRSLVPAGADAHQFTPTPADARALAHAQLVIINGLRYEGWMDRLVKAAGYQGDMLTASTGIKARQSGGGADPHAWQDLSNVQVYVENIRAALANRMPANAAEINARAAAYKARLKALDDDTRARIAKIPKDRRRVVTDHDAFGYFADAYGVSFIAPRGWSTESEPSAESVATIVRQLRVQKAGALLMEIRGDPRLLDRIAKEAGVKVVTERLYADALSPSGGPADTFMKMFRHNVQTLCDAMTAGLPVGR